MFRRQALHCASQQLGGIGPLPSDGRWLLIFNHWGNHQCLSAAFRAQRTQSPSIGDSNDPSRNQGITAKAASLSPHDGESVVDHFVNECESTGNPPQKAREALVIQQMKRPQSFAILHPDALHESALVVLGHRLWQLTPRELP